MVPSKAHAKSRKAQLVPFNSSGEEVEIRLSLEEHSKHKGRRKESSSTQSSERNSPFRARDHSSITMIHKQARSVPSNTMLASDKEFEVVESDLHDMTVRSSEDETIDCENCATNCTNFTNYTNFTNCTNFTNGTGEESIYRIISTTHSAADDRENDQIPAVTVSSSWELLRSQPARWMIDTNWSENPSQSSRKHRTVTDATDVCTKDYTPVHLSHESPTHHSKKVSFILCGERIRAIDHSDRYKDEPLAQKLSPSTADSTRTVYDFDNQASTIDSINSINCVQSFINDDDFHCTDDPKSHISGHSNKFTKPDDTHVCDINSSSTQDPRYTKLVKEKSIFQKITSRMSLSKNKKDNSYSTKRRQRVSLPTKSPESDTIEPNIYHKLPMLLCGSSRKELNTSDLQPYKTTKDLSNFIPTRDGNPQTDSLRLNQSTTQDEEGVNVGCYRPIVGNNLASLNSKTNRRTLDTFIQDPTISSNRHDKYSSTNKLGAWSSSSSSNSSVRTKKTDSSLLLFEDNDDASETIHFQPTELPRIHTTFANKTYYHRQLDNGYTYHNNNEGIRKSFDDSEVLTSVHSFRMNGTITMPSASSLSEHRRTTHTNVPKSLPTINELYRHDTLISKHKVKNTLGELFANFQELDNQKNRSTKSLS